MMNFKNRLIPVVIYSILCFFISIASGLSNGVTFGNILFRGFLFSVIGAIIVFSIFFFLARMFEGVDFSTPFSNFQIKSQTNIVTTEQNAASLDTSANTNSDAINSSSLGTNVDIVLDATNAEDAAILPPTQNTSTGGLSANSDSFVEQDLVVSSNTTAPNDEVPANTTERSINALEKLVIENKNPDKKKSYTKTVSNKRKRMQELQEAREKDEKETVLQNEIDKTMFEFKKSPEKVQMAVASLMKKDNNNS